MLNVDVQYVLKLNYPTYALNGSLGLYNIMLTFNFLNVTNHFIVGIKFKNYNLFTKVLKCMQSFTLKVFVHFINNWSVVRNH